MNQPTCQKNPDTQQLLKERMATLNVGRRIERDVKIELLFQSLSN